MAYARHKKDDPGLWGAFAWQWDELRIRRDIVTGESILDTLEGDGITLALEEKGLRVHGGKLSSRMQLLIKDNKQAVIEALRERERLAALPVETPTITVETPADQQDAVWTAEQLGNLYRAIGDGSVLGLNWEVKGVPQVHKETAKQALETLMNVGASAAMAAVVAVYKERMEGRKASGKDVFPLQVALSCAAAHPKPKNFPDWYQELLDESYKGLEDAHKNIEEAVFTEVAA